MKRTALYLLLLTQIAFGQYPIENDGTNILGMSGIYIGRSTIDDVKIMRPHASTIETVIKNDDDTYSSKQVYRGITSSWIWYVDGNGIITGIMVRSDVDRGNRQAFNDIYSHRISTMGSPNEASTTQIVWRRGKGLYSLSYINGVLTEIVGTNN